MSRPDDPDRTARTARRRRPPRPLDARRLEELALRYVGRFATTRAKAADYLQRKLRESGWEETAPPAVDALVGRLAAAGYIDDAAFADMKARSMMRRGYGRRRLTGALHAAGVAEEDRVGSDAIAAAERIEAAWRFAARKRLGPFAAVPAADRAQRDRAFAAFLRAGHDAALAGRILALPPGSPREALDED